ncbi:hypothetical protein [Phosphitispora sp. TUW77]|uniref:hypothetical protein n=1 Tax=Phosphitispora sp. TUW77 TaxID=3152361 RepID=UPI003AB37F8B
MREKGEPLLKVVPGGHFELEALHDRIISRLDSNEKRGIRQLLQKNNETCKKLIFPYIKSRENQSAVMTALAGILEAHARECYTIGYLDCVLNGDRE